MKTGNGSGLVAILTGFAAIVVALVPSQAEEPAEPVSERLHSDLPLYTFDWDDLWPRSFFSEESFGCTSPVGFGDWRFTPADADDDEYWDRYDNYGVFHCAAIIRTAGERAGLDEAESKYGFFVRLGTARHGSGEWELWALQVGVVPGSDYVLLAREVGRPGPVESFRVLRRQCPSSMIREASGFDIWRTRYCAIDSRAELLALALRMLRLPPRGMIARVADPD